MSLYEDEDTVLIKAIIRRQYLNNILRWIMRRPGFELTRTEITQNIEGDAEAMENISELPEVLRLLKSGATEETIERYVRKALTGSDDIPEYRGRGHISLSN